MKTQPHTITSKLPFAVLCLILTAWGELSAVTVDDYIASGRASLALETPAALQNADTAFANALNLEPTNQTANFFRAATRLALLQSKPEFQTLLSNLGVVVNNGNIYSLHYSVNKNANGDVIPAAGASSDQIISYVHNTLLPAVIQAEANLESVWDQAFSLQLTAAETAMLDVKIDYGDVRIALSILYGIEAAGYLMDSYNLSVSFPFLYNLATGNLLNVQEVIKDFPNLFTFSTSNRRFSALTAFQDANSRYQFGSLFIRTIRTGSTGNDHLFNISPQDAADETQFRQLLAAADQSLTTPTVMTGAASLLGLSSDPTAYFWSGFITTVPPRNLIPMIAKNFVIQNSWPDSKLAGILPSGSQSMLNTIANHYSVTVPIVNINGLNNTSVVLNWTAPAKGWMLQQNSTLISSSNWSNVASQPTLVNGQNQQGVVRSAPKMFFRVFHP